MKATRSDDALGPIPAEDTAPREAPPGPSPNDWGVTEAEARALLQRQVCPICGDGPFKSPLIHTGKKHGIPRHVMRDICGMTSTEVVADPELSERFREIHAGKDPEWARTMSGKPRRKYRMTRAGKQNLAANLADVTPEQSRAALAVAHGPEATEKRAAGLRAKYQADDDARAALVKRLHEGREKKRQSS